MRGLTVLWVLTCDFFFAKHSAKMTDNLCESSDEESASDFSSDVVPDVAMTPVEPKEW